MRSILMAMFFTLFSCAPSVYTVITDDISKYQGEGLTKFYIIHHIDTLHTPSGVFYRLQIQEIPKE